MTPQQPDLDEFYQWIRAQTAAAGLTLISDNAIESVKINATATILRVHTSQRVLYFKQPLPSFAFEAPLTAALARWLPASLPEVIAIDEARGWLLMVDAGQTLKALTQTAFDLNQWIAMLRDYAAVQQTMVAHVPDLVRLKIPDRRLAQLPQLYETLLLAADVESVLLVDQPDGITAGDLAALRGYGAHLRDLCDQLAAFNIPETLHHDDFHVGNVVLRGDLNVFIDWGESGLAHPFFSLMLALRYAKLVFHCDDERLDHLRDAYLQCWTQYAPLADLRQAFLIAAQLGAFCRALTWVQVSRSVKVEDRADVADAAPYWLLTFLRNTPFQA